MNTDDAQTLLHDGLDALDALNPLIKALSPPLRLGTIARILQHAITFGARLYNVGYSDLCAELYAACIRQLTTLTLTPSPTARRALDDLTQALQRADANPNPDDAAWSLRHLLDKTLIARDVLEQHAHVLTDLGQAAFMRGDFGGAEAILRDAFDKALEANMTRLDHPQPLDDIDTLSTLHMTPFFLGHAQIGLAQYATAARTLRDALRAAPAWVESDFSLRELARHSAHLQRVFAHLQDYLDHHADDRDACFLLAYLRFFSGQRDHALRSLTMLLQQDPFDDAVQVMLTAGQDTD